MKQTLNPSVRLILTLAAISLPALSGGQASTGVRQASAGVGLAPSVSSYVATGSTTDADLARLRATLLKIAGIEQVEMLARPGGVTLHIRGVQLTSLFISAAKSLGYAMRPMRVRVYLVSGSSADTDLARLREALAKVPDVEQVDPGKSNGAAILRVRAEAPVSSLAAAAKTIGYEIQPVSSYIASGSAAEVDVTRLRKALEQVGGVEKVEMRSLPGGAAVVIRGDVMDAALAMTAKSVGFGLLPVSDAGGSYRFRVIGVASAGEEDKLRQALLEGIGSGEFYLLKTSSGLQLDVVGSTATSEQIIAAAKASGADLHPLETITSLSVDANGERITPAAPGERTLEMVANEPVVGALAPDFTLIMKDGKSKMSLSSSRGKKPVVLIFGSYT